MGMPIETEINIQAAFEVTPRFSEMPQIRTEFY
jgi:hypothetical protein